MRIPFSGIAEMQYETAKHRISCDLRSPGRDAEVQNDLFLDSEMNHFQDAQTVT